MKRARNVLRRPAAAVVCALQLVFLLAAAAPRMVWCHRTGGKAVLEFELAASECPCGQCVLQREIERREHEAIPPSGPVIRASRCVHNEIDSEAGRTSGSLQASSKSGSAARLPAGTLSTVPDKAFLRAPSLSGGRDSDPGPPGATALRC